MNDLLNQLREERKKRGVRLIDLAESVGYHRTAIGNWERGKHAPTIRELADWCQALGVGLKIEIVP